MHKTPNNQGAEAVVTNCIYFNTPAISKRRLPKRYRVHSLDSKLRLERTKIEARIMHRAKATGTNCPLVLSVDLERCELIETRLNGVKLVDYLQDKKNQKNAKRILADAGTQLAKLHLANISHGDSTTSNFMTDGKSVFIFDFGLSQFNATDEERAIDLLLFFKSVSELQFKYFIKGYAAQYGEKQTKQLISKIREIESRARYVER